MVGHPTETDEDIEAIADLTLKARGDFPPQRRDQRDPVHAESAHAVPVDRDDAGQGHVRTGSARSSGALAKHRVTVDADSPEWAEVQGVLSRGDRRLAPVLWETEKLTLRGFGEALARHGLAAEEFLGERTPGAFEPWDIVESGVRPSFYRYELRLSEKERLGHRCPPGCEDCLTCGVCRATVESALVAADISTVMIRRRKQRASYTTHSRSWTPSAR